MFFNAIILEKQNSSHIENRAQNKKFLGKFCLIRVRNSTQTSSDVKNTMAFAVAYISAGTKRDKTFRCLATVSKTKVFCAEGRTKVELKEDQTDWHTNVRSQYQILHPCECLKTSKSRKKMIVPKRIYFLMMMPWTVSRSKICRKNTDTIHCG